MKTKIFTISALILLFSFRIWQTSGCISFNSFHINPLTVKIAIESQRLTDDKPNDLTSKFFHNKISTGIFENSKNLITVSSPVLLISILSPIGIFLSIFIFANLKKIKSPLFYLHIAYILISSILLTLTSPKIAMYNFALSLYTFTFWSVKLTSGRIKPVIIFIILIIISFWYYSLDWQIKSICNEIFFN